MSEEKTKRVPDQAFEVNIFDSIETKSVAAILGRIRANLGQEPMIIYLASPGGAVASGTSIVEVLESKLHPITIITETWTASFCTLFTATANAVHLCYPSTRFLFHAGRWNLNGLDSEVKTLIDMSNAVENEIIEKFIARAGITRKYFDKHFYGPDKTLFGHEMLMLGDKGAADGLIVKDLGECKYIIRKRDGELYLYDAYRNFRKDLDTLPKVTMNEAGQYMAEVKKK